jgi:hypothetical protein
MLKAKDGDFFISDWLRNRDANPDKDGKMRDHATLEQLLVLANLENMNAEFIHMELPQSDRIKRLNVIAIRQMQTLTARTARQEGVTIHAQTLHRRPPQRTLKTNRNRPRARNLGGCGAFSCLSVPERRNSI